MQDSGSEKNGEQAKAVHVSAKIEVLIIQQVGRVNAAAYIFLPTPSAPGGKGWRRRELNPCPNNL